MVVYEKKKIHMLSRKNMHVIEFLGTKGKKQKQLVHIRKKKLIKKLFFCKKMFLVGSIISPDS